MSKIFRSICVLIGICMSLLGCTVAEEIIVDTPGPALGIDQPLLIGQVEVRIQEVHLLKSYQTHYLMTNSQEPYIFYQVVLSISGLDDPLSWGEQNTRLFCEGHESDD